MENGLSRNINLDILRIVAALMVMMVHVGYEFPWINDHTWYGYYGTMLFFSLSGFLIMKSLERGMSIRSFYKKRVVRIIPLYFVILIVTYVLDLITYFPQMGVKVFSLSGNCGINFLRYFGFLQMFIPSGDFGLWNNRHGLWTMSAFMFFYLAAPFVHKIVRKYYVSLAIFIVLLFAHNPFVSWLESAVTQHFPNASEISSFASWNPLSVFYSFFGGVVVYLAVKEKRQFGLALIMVLALAYNGFNWYQWDITMLLLLLFAASLPNIITSKGKIASLVTTCSNASFALYLTHTIVLEYVMKLQESLVPVIRNKGFLAFVIMVCLLAGYGAWRFIEKPLSKRIG